MYAILSVDFHDQHSQIYELRNSLYKYQVIEVESIQTSDKLFTLG